MLNIRHEGDGCGNRLVSNGIFFNFIGFSQNLNFSNSQNSRTVFIFLKFNFKSKNLAQLLMVARRIHFQVAVAFELLLKTWLILAKFHFKNSPNKQSEFEFRTFLYVFDVLRAIQLFDLIY
jgi:hypothetical protein